MYPTCMHAHAVVQEQALWFHSGELPMELTAHCSDGGGGRCGMVKVCIWVGGGGGGSLR